MLQSRKLWHWLTLGGAAMFSYLAGAQPSTGMLSVMTQNLYLGVDVTEVIHPESLVNLPRRTSAMYRRICASDYVGRMHALADRILQYNPDVVGLQEVSLFMRQVPSDFYRGNTNKASTVEIDFLALLLDALSQRGMNYEAASVHHNVEAEFPVYRDPDYLPNSDVREPALDDIRMIDRDVLLVRQGIQVVDTFAQGFIHNLKVPVRNPALKSIQRGFHGVKLALADQNLVVVNTHLEVKTGIPFLNIQHLQSEELMSYLTKIEEPVVLVGDFNDPPSFYRHTPYRTVKRGGFADSWQLAANSQLRSGFTCCQAADLKNPFSQLQERIDYVFAREAAGAASSFKVDKTQLINHKEEHKTPFGLWYSDHAGVVAELALDGVFKEATR